MVVEKERPPSILKSAERVLKFIDRNFKSSKQRQILVAGRWAKETYLHHVVDIAVLVEGLAKNINSSYWFFVQQADYPYWVADSFEEAPTPSGSKDIVVFPREQHEGWTSFFKDRPFTMQEVLRNGGQWGTARAFQRGDFLPQTLPVGYESGLIIWRAKNEDLLDVAAAGLRNPGLRQGMTRKEFLLDTLLTGTEFYYVLLPDHSMKEHFLEMSEAGMAVD